MSRLILTIPIILLCISTLFSQTKININTNKGDIVKKKITINNYGSKDDVNANVNWVPYNPEDNSNRLIFSNTKDSFTIILSLVNYGKLTAINLADSLYILIKNRGSFDYGFIEPSCNPSSVIPTKTAYDLYHSIVNPNKIDYNNMLFCFRFHYTDKKHKKGGLEAILKLSTFYGKGVLDEVDLATYKKAKNFLEEKKLW